jgi:hypothetical protein
MAEKTANIPVNEQELDILIAGLGELPTKLSYQLVTKLANIKQTMNAGPFTGPAEPVGGDSSPSV